MQEPLLTLKGLRKAYGSNEVLTHVDLEVRPGEVVGLLGRNGAGKSTLAGILAGETGFDGGEISMNGGGWDPKRVTLVDPEHQLDGNLTIAQSMFRSSLTPLSDEEMVIRARRALAEASIPLPPTDRLKDLSPTDLRMTEVARMLADPRDLIIIDELSNGFNRIEQEDLRYSMVRNVEEGRGVLYVTHHLEEALRLCDRIAVLRDGIVVEVFTSVATSVEEVTEAIFGEIPEQLPRHAIVSGTGQVALDVSGLSLGSTPVDFEVRRGEVLGFAGTRDSGVNLICDTLLGRRPDSAATMTLAGRGVQISTPNQLPGLGIAVITRMSDPENEAYQARNLSMLDCQADDELDELDELIEDTTEILLLFKEAEERISKAIQRPVQSTGQRRLQQLESVANLDCQVLVLIHPGDGLDLAAQAQFNRMLREITARGVAVVLFSGNEDELYQLSDRIMVIADGAVAAHWRPSEISIEHLLAVSRGNYSQELLVG